MKNWNIIAMTCDWFFAAIVTDQFMWFEIELERKCPHWEDDAENWHTYECYCLMTNKHKCRTQQYLLFALFSRSHHMPVRLKDSPKTQSLRMQHAEFLGNTTSLVLVHENDIYIRQSPADEEDIRLTSTGVSGLIYNGVSDWLYQGNCPINSFTNCCPHFSLTLSIPEEILKSQKALWSSHDGMFLLYATFNDSNVGQMVYPWFSASPVLQSGKKI